MSTLFRFLSALIVAYPLVAWPQSSLLPVDQAASIPDFFTFRAQLQAAIGRRDVEAVTSVLSKDVKLSFGGDSGIDAFKRIWKPEAPDSQLWDTLATVLSLGGTFSTDSNAFTAPYVFSRWPNGKDSFAHVVAVGSGVRVRAAPNTTAKVVGTLDFSIVEVVDSYSEKPKWFRVKLTDDRIGFVDGRFVRSPIDYRVSFEKVDGRWQMVFFVAGD